MGKTINKKTLGVLTELKKNGIYFEGYSHRKHRTRGNILDPITRFRKEKINRLKLNDLLYD